MRRTKIKADHNDVAIGERLRTARLSLGLSQTALGQQIGVSYQQIYKYESGQTRLSLSLVQRLSVVLQIKIADLVPETGQGAGSLLDLDPVAIRLVQALAAIKDPDARRCVFKVIDAFVRRS
jgi:transcriptional regulator with XRE-family HTH domain